MPILLRPPTETDPRLDDYRIVRDPDLVRHRGLFIGEGRRVVRLLLTQSRFPLRSVLVTDTARQVLDDLLAAHEELPVYEVPADWMTHVAGVHIHQGCLALGERVATPPWRELAARATRLLALESVGNPDNVGGVFRNALAFGVDGVLLGPGCADPLYRKAIRTSLGASLRVPYAEVAEWPSTLLELSRDGWAVLGATPSVTAPALGAVAPSIDGRPTTIVLGHEGDGLTAETLAACDMLARIPMAPGADSLNVAAAAAVVLYELSR